MDPDQAALDLAPRLYNLFQAPDKSAYLNFFFFYFSTKTYVVGTQKNRLNETVLLSSQNT